MLIISLRNFVELRGAESLNSALNVAAWVSELSLSQVKDNLVYFFGATISFGSSISLSSFSMTNVVNFSTSTYESLFTYGTDFLSSSTFKLAERIFLPILWVMGTEILVDWLKHAFIAKFNRIDTGVYRVFEETLAKDIKEKRQARFVTKRIGFVTLPLACLCIRIGQQVLSGVIVKEQAELLFLLFLGAYVIACLVKVAVGFYLLRLTKRYTHSQDDGFENVRTWIDEKQRESQGERRGVTEDQLRDIERFTMLKRIIS